MLISIVISSLIACGGSEPKAEAPKAEAPKVEAPAPAAAPAAPAATYVPTELAAKAYEAAKAAGADTKPNALSGNAEAIAKGKANYAGKCASCHGVEGGGDGVVGAALNPKPANFKDKARWDFTTVGTKQWIVANGIAGSAMAKLVADDNEAAEIVAYLETLPR